MRYGIFYPKTYSKLFSKHFSVNSTDDSVLTSTKRSCQEEARDIYLAVTLECWTSTRIYELSEEIKIPLWSKVRIALVWEYFCIDVLITFRHQSTSEIWRNKRRENWKVLLHSFSWKGSQTRTMKPLFVTWRKELNHLLQYKLRRFKI